MIIPLVHLGGTSKEDLLKDYSDAIEQVDRLTSALAVCSPHARDYNVHNGIFPVQRTIGGSFNQAVREHSERVSALRRIRGELRTIQEGIANQ